MVLYVCYDGIVDTVHVLIDCFFFYSPRLILCVYVFLSVSLVVVVVVVVNAERYTCIYMGVCVQGLAEYADSIGFLRPPQRDASLAHIPATFEPLLPGTSEAAEPAPSRPMPAPEAAGVEAARQYVAASRNAVTSSEVTHGQPADDERASGGGGTSGGGGGGGGARRRLNTDPPAGEAQDKASTLPAGASMSPSAANAAALKKRKKSRSTPSEKTEKGLRHFSLRVCQKVEDKGRTTYNEVADELVAELVGERGDTGATTTPGGATAGNAQRSQQTPSSSAKSGGETTTKQYDEKNIRRRVYDALNVLMALDVISKEKKEISWRGLPDSHDQQLEQLRLQERQSLARIDKKRAYLKELVEQYDVLTALLRRNMSGGGGGGGGGIVQDPNGRDGEHRDTELQRRNGIALPFLLVRTRNDAQVEVEMSDDMQTVSIDFDSTPFEVHDYFYVLSGLRERGLLSVVQQP